MSDTTARKFSAADMLRTRDDELATTLRRFDHDARLTEAQRRELDGWIEHLAIMRSLATNTAARYLEYVGYFFVWLNGKDLSIATVRQKDVEAWQAGLFMDHSDSNATRRVKLTAVKQFYSWRQGMGGGTSPVADMKGPKRDKPIPRKFKTAELNRIFGACDLGTAKGRRDFSVLLFVYTTGARKSELANLSLSQLEIHARGGRVRFKGKGAKEREVPFNSLTAEALRHWFTDREQLKVYDTDAVWVGLSGQSKGQRLKQTGLEGIINSKVTAAKIAADDRAQGLHRMRATFATDMYDETKDIELVRVLMGHDDINTTRQYIEISEHSKKFSMPNSRTAEVVGLNTNRTPLWLKNRQEALSDEK